MKIDAQPAGVSGKDLASLDLEKVPGYRAGQPPIRLDDVTFDDELEQMWGRRWGATSMIGKLKTAMLQRPGPEDAATDLFERDPTFFNLSGHGVPGWRSATGRAELPDLEIMREQHDNYARLLREEGVEVLYANIPDWQIGVYTPLRAGFFPEPGIVRGGAIIPRTALAWKRGLERVWTKVLVDAGVPIIYTVHGSGIFEGRLHYLDARTVLLGIGHRTNREGARQVEMILRNQGVEEVRFVDLPGNFLTHLCMAFSYVAHRLAVVYPPALPYDLLRWLETKGIDLIEASDDEMAHLATNCVALGPKKIVMAKGASDTVKALKAAGVEVLEIDLSEIIKASGGPMCLTLSLVRDDGPSL